MSSSKKRFSKVGSLLQERFAQAGWFLAGLAFGFTALSLTLASVPKQGQSKSAAETVELQDSVSEIQAGRTSKVDFDSDIAGLAAREKLYREDPRSVIAASRKGRPSIALRRVLPAPLKKRR
jgi:hypothetical protein